MKKLLIVIVALFLIGCEKPTYEWTATSPGDLSHIEGLSGCTYHAVRTGDGWIRVIRCPNSSVTTTYKSGKTTRTNVIVDRDIPTIELKCHRMTNGSLTCNE